LFGLRMSYSSLTRPYVKPPSLQTGCSLTGSTTSLPVGLRPATPSAMCSITTSPSTTATVSLLFLRCTAEQASTQHQSGERLRGVRCVRQTQMPAALCGSATYQLLHEAHERHDMLGAAATCNHWVSPNARARVFVVLWLRHATSWHCIFPVPSACHTDLLAVSAAELYV
jgi:hypothetical protein